MKNTKWENNENLFESLDNFQNDMNKPKKYKKYVPIVGPKMAKFLKEKYPDIEIIKFISENIL